MTKRLSITVSDETYNELAPWRDRMNISLVCSGAILDEIKWLKRRLVHPDRADTELNVDVDDVKFTFAKESE